MDEFLRSVEATLFASAEPLSVADISAHVGEGDVEPALASSFLAALELARRGRLDIAQDQAFAPIRLRAA